MKNIYQRLNQIEKMARIQEKETFAVFLGNGLVRFGSRTMPEDEFNQVHAAGLKQLHDSTLASTGRAPVMGIDFRAYDGR